MRSILLVDDTPENLSLMSSILKDEYKVKVANHGEKALRIVRSESPPDLILLDILMPDINGYEICKILKSDPLTKEIPIIFLTALTDIEDEKHGLELGAVDYIFKPISPAIIKARIKTHLNLKATNDFLREKNSIIEQQIEMAKIVQEILLPKSLPIIENAKISYSYKPIHWLSGDFLDFYYSRSQRKLGFFICDVCGHGIASSMITTMVKISLHLWGEYLDDPYGNLKKIQRQLHGKLGDYFLTGIMGCLNLDTGKMIVSSAGHPPGLIINEHGVFPFKMGGSLITDEPYGDFIELEFQLKKGDTIVLYTDGIYDFNSSNQEKHWMLEDFISFVKNIKNLDKEKLSTQLVEEIDQFNGGNTVWNDDISVLVIQYK